MRDQSYFNKLCSIVIATIALSACGGGDSDTTATSDPATAATPATPSTSTSNFAGTYTGTASSIVSFANTYSGPMTLTLTRDVTGNYTVSGQWDVTRTNSAGPQETITDLIHGTVSSAGALNATGSFKVKSITATVDAATGKITGNFVYTGYAGQDVSAGVGFTLSK